MTKTDPRWRSVGRPCLDFAMTGGRGEWSRYERLHAPADLSDWLALSVGRVVADEQQLAAAHDLRHAIQQMAFALLAGEGPPAGPVRAVNAFAARPPLVRALDPRSQELVVFRPTAEAALSELARDALALAADPAARGRVRQCESPDCRLLFFDDSRPGRRRWCSAGRCGDRARARAYRARRKKEDA